MTKNLLNTWLFLIAGRIIALSGSTASRISDPASLFDQQEADSITTGLFKFH